MTDTKRSYPTTHPIRAWRTEAALHPAELDWLRARKSAPLARLSPAPATYDCLLVIEHAPVLLAAQRCPRTNHLLLYPFLDQPPVRVPLADAAALRPVFYH
jgi:hypothetical protein